MTSIPRAARLPGRPGEPRREQQRGGVGHEQRDEVERRHRDRRRDRQREVIRPERRGVLVGEHLARVRMREQDGRQHDEHPLEDGEDQGRREQFAQGHLPAGQGIHLQQIGGGEVLPEILPHELRTQHHRPRAENQRHAADQACGQFVWPAPACIRAR